MREGRKYSDSEIINGIERNDSAILEYLYNDCFRTIRYLVISNSGSEEDAKDVFQESLVVLYRKIKETKLELSSSLVTFVYSIARLIWLKELHNRSKRGIELKDTLDELIHQDQGIIDIIERNERLRLYREKFEELSEDCKRILQMFMNNISIKDITGIMGYSSEQHTKNRRFRCKKSLIHRIRNSGNFKELGNEEDSDD